MKNDINQQEFYSILLLIKMSCGDDLREVFDSLSLSDNEKEIVASLVVRSYISGITASPLMRNVFKKLTAQDKFDKNGLLKSEYALTSEEKTYLQHPYNNPPIMTYNDMRRCIPKIYPIFNNDSKPDITDPRKY